jgi:hypothetical protein
MLALSFGHTFNNAGQKIVELIAGKKELKSTIKKVIQRQRSFHKVDKSRRGEGV